MTVIILTSGTSWTVPGDWTNTNQIETWGDGGAGGGGFQSAGAGGGGGGYASISNQTGLSGSIPIAIGSGGVHDGSYGTGGSGTGTSFGSGPLVAASGGGGGTNGQATGGTGGAGGTGTTGGSFHTGGTGGQGNSTDFLEGGGGGGAAGSSGNGANGQAGGTVSGNGGSGGTGDNGSGGAGGTGGTGNGPAGTANTEGGGGGAGGAQADLGGAGGLPGGGGGGGGSGPNNFGGDGAGGQIRITYTPLASNITPIWTDLPPSRYKTKWKSPLELYDMQGWQRSPLSASSLPEIRQQPLEVPPGKWNWSRYQHWEQSPLSDNAPPAADIRWYDLPPVGRFNPARFQDWQRGVIPAEYLVPAPWTEVPRGRYNGSRYQDWSQAPQPNSVQGSLPQPFYDLPPRSWDRRMQYQGVQLAPQPEIMSPPQPVYDVPPGRWNAGRYQDWQQSYQRLEFSVPAPQVDVPRGVRRFDYAGWQAFQTPPDVGPLLSSSLCYALPPPGRLQSMSRYMDLFQGAGVAPQPGNVVPTVMAMWLPLVGVGNQGP